MNKKYSRFGIIKTVLILLFFTNNYYTGSSQDLNIPNYDDLKRIEDVKSEKIDIKGTVSLFGHRRYTVIKNYDDICTIARSGININHYIKALKNINFNLNTLIGINIQTSGCNTSPDIIHKIYNDKENKIFIIYIGNTNPPDIFGEQVSHPYWIIVPALPEGYSVEFFIEDLCSKGKPGIVEPVM